MATLFGTERLVVHIVGLEGVDALLAILGEPDMVRLFGSGTPWSRPAVERFVRSYPDGDPRLISAPGLALLKPDLEVVGFGGVGYYLAEGNTADLLFVFDRRHRGRGLATELARAALAAGFRHPEVAIVFATVHPANLASIRVLEKCGLTFDRHLPERNRLLYSLARPPPGRRHRADNQLARSRTHLGRGRWPRRDRD